MARCFWHQPSGPESFSGPRAHFGSEATCSSLAARSLGRGEVQGRRRGVAGDAILRRTVSVRNRVSGVQEIRKSGLLDSVISSGVISPGVISRCVEGGTSSIRRALGLKAKEKGAPRPWAHTTPCTLASRCALQRWAGEGWRVARAQESQSFRGAEAGGRGGASRGRVAKLAGASYFLDSAWAAEQPSSRAAEQPSSRAAEQPSSPNSSFLHAALQPISPGRSASSRTNEGMQAAGAGPPCCSSPGHKGPANRV